MSKLRVFSWTMLIGCLLMWTTKSLGGPFSYVSIRGLEKEADAVVIGSGQPKSAKNADSTVVSIEIAVSRILKGSLTPQSLIKAVWIAPEPRNAAVNSSRTVSGMWFLKFKEQSGWEILPISQGEVTFDYTYIPISSDALPSSFAYTTTTPITEKIINEIGAQIEKSEGNATWIRDLCITFRVITAKDFPTLSQLYAKWLKSTAPHLRLLGLHGLISYGDDQALAQLLEDRATLETIAKDSILGQAICNRHLLAPSQSQSQSFIGILSRFIAGENPPHLRRCAAYTLKAIHTKATLPYLAQLLESDILELRYDGMMGLALFANNLPMVTMENTRSMGWLHAESNGPYTTEETRQNMPMIDICSQNESKYLDFWKNWWKTHKQALTQQ